MVFYQSMGDSKQAIRNVRKTIGVEATLKAFDFDSVRDYFLDPIRSELELLLRGKSFQLWGLDIEASKNLRLESGDNYFLFALGTNRIRLNYICQFLCNPHSSPKLAKKFWSNEKFQLILFWKCTYVDLSWDDVLVHMPGLSIETGVTKPVSNVSAALQFINDQLAKASRGGAGIYPELTIAQTKNFASPFDQDNRGADNRRSQLYDFSASDHDSFNKCIEGAEESVKVDRRERDPRIRGRAIELAKANCNGVLRCAGCEMSFAERYGDRGLDFIEAHHTNPLSSGAREINLNDDGSIREYITLLCSNCHRMVHRGETMLDLEGLKAIICHCNPDSGRVAKT